MSGVLKGCCLKPDLDSRRGQEHASCTTNHISVCHWYMCLASNCLSFLGCANNVLTPRWISSTDYCEFWVFQVGMLALRGDDIDCLFRNFIF